MGVKRGKCQENGCNCSRYKAVDDEEGGGVCLNCGHFPGNHENLGILNDSAQYENGKIIYADSDPLGLLQLTDGLFFCFFDNFPLSPSQYPSSPFSPLFLLFLYLSSSSYPPHFQLLFPLSFPSILPLPPFLFFLFLPLPFDQK